MTLTASKIAVSTMRLLTVGLDAQECRVLSEFFSYCQVTSMPMDMDGIFCQIIDSFSKKSQALQPDFVICGEPPKGIMIEELAQTLRLRFPNTPIFSIIRDRKLYHRKSAVHNGFTDAFLFPFDSGPLRRTISDTLRKLTNGVVQSYRSILLADLRVNSQLTFDISIYLPRNLKYVPFLRTGMKITAEHFKNLHEHGLESVFVNTDEMPKFYAYANQGTISFTERRHRIEDEVHPILRGIFRGPSIPSLEDGKKLVDGCKKAVDSYILTLPKNQLARQITATMGDIGDNYDHALNTSTYAALFSVALGEPNPGDMALAGLFHDLGEIEFTGEIPTFGLERLNWKSSSPYSQHVSKTINLIQELRLPVERGVIDAIQHHHEWYNGTGFPNIAHGDSIPRCGQILAFADRFDYLTRHEPEQPSLSIEEALKKVQRELLGSMKQTPINPKLVRTILALFGVY